jgi:branched-chain amino acid transport system substrate-binding protein
MVPGLRVQFRSPLLRRGCVFGLLAGALAVLSACSGISELFNAATPSSQQQPPPSAPMAPQGSSEVGTGAVRVALILPLSAGGNAGTVALSMKNAAEMALAEFNSPNVQLLVKDDGGNSGGAQQAAQQALSEGAEIIVGPLFAHSVSTVGAVARQRGVPVIAFSTDATVAARGVYLLSFLPESDVDRIVEYSIASGKRSFAAMLSEGAYGNVVEAEFKQVVARKGGRVVALERYSLDANKMQVPAKVVAQAARGADAVFIPEGPEVVPSVVQALTAAGLTKRVQLLGTGLWDDPRIFNDASLQGGLYAAPDGTGFRNFSARYRTRYGQDPVRTATLAYDAVALVAALVKTQGPQRFSDQTLTNSSGFAGIDGLFRFRSDGTNERGLAVLRVTPGGGQVVSPPPRAFGNSGI